jgi:glycosyltransferase involved in cell wall biosynthesis
VDEDTCILIPAFNASGTLGKVIRDIRKYYGQAPIVVIDDGSTDNTGDIVRRLDVVLLSNRVNSGVGASIKKGVEYGFTSNRRFFVTIGADDQRDVRDIGRLLQELKREAADIVLGSKFLYKGQRMPHLRKLGNRAITFVVNRLFGSHFSDVTSGFKAFGRSVARDVSDLADGYAFDTDLCIRVACRGYKCKEVPVKVIYGHDTTRMRNVFAVGMQILLLIIMRRLAESRRRSLHPDHLARERGPVGIER